MFFELNASEFKGNNQFYNLEFEDVLSKIIECYRLMIEHKVPLENDENKIRDVLLIRYLKNNSIRRKIGLNQWLFDREVPEDFTEGRTDIKVQSPNTFEDTNAYYIIECKRIDSVNPNGLSGLNNKYIENGICRFCSQLYGTYYKTNGMLGFIVHSINIRSNISSLNTLLEKSITSASTTSYLEYHSITNNFEYTYVSRHLLSSGEILIYHVMLDVSSLIT